MLSPISQPKNRRADSLPDDLKEHYEEMFGEKFPLSLNEAMDYVKFELGNHQFFPQVLAHAGKVRVEYHWSVPYQVNRPVLSVNQLGNISRTAGGLGYAPTFKTTTTTTTEYKPMMDYWSTNELTKPALDKFIKKIVTAIEKSQKDG